MIHLTIKAKSLADAVVAAYSQGIEKPLIALRSYNDREVLGSLEDTPHHRYLVLAWYNHTNFAATDEHGFPQGTLLLYTWPDATGVEKEILAPGA